MSSIGGKKRGGGGGVNSTQGRLIMQDAVHAISLATAGHDANVASIGKERGANLTEKDDLYICKGYRTATVDPIRGIGQRLQNKNVEDGNEADDFMQRLLNGAIKACDDALKAKVPQVEAVAIKQHLIAGLLSK